MRQFLLAAIVLATAASATAQEIWWNPGVIDEVRHRGLLKVGAGHFEPWVMCDVGGDLIGYEVDVANKLAQDLGVRIQFVRTDWYFIVPALIERQFDIVVSGMSITPARALLVSFSRPYSEFGTIIVANAGRTEGFARNHYDRAGVTLAVRRGSTTEALVRREFPQASPLALDSDAEILEAVSGGGRAHAAAVDQVTAARWIHEHPSVLRQAFAAVFDRLPQAIALRKGDVDGLNFFDSWVTHHRVNGWLGERWRYWFETREWEALVATDPAACAETFDATAAPLLAVPGPMGHP